MFYCFCLVILIVIINFVVKLSKFVKNKLKNDQVSKYNVSLFFDIQNSGVTNICDSGIQFMPKETLDTNDSKIKTVKAVLKNKYILKAVFG